MPVITIPTRVTSNSSTLVDHIITNNTELDLNPAVIEADISDHFPVLCIITKPRPQLTYESKKMLYRDKSSFRVDSFCENLEAKLINVFSQQPELNNDNFNEMFELFSTTVLSTINAHAPLKPLSRKQKKILSKPWLTKGLLTSIKHKRSMFKTDFLSDDDDKIIFYKEYVNKLTKLKALSKTDYFSSAINDIQKDLRKLWNVIRSVLPASQDCASAIPLSLKINGHTSTNDQAISEHFNEFFCSIGANLADKFNQSAPSSLSQYLEQRVSPSIYLDVPNLSEIINAIQALSLNKSIGHDNIPPYYLRITSSILAPYLHIFIDFCFTKGVFPETCTIAKIVPIFKKGERENPFNYRPISILTCFSKILEQIIHKRLISFFDKHGIIQHTQYGFQLNVSTNHALVDVVTQSFENINNNMYTGLIFLDLTKAFDTVNHEMLLHKLDHYGIRGQSNNLLRAFLKRKQYVSINSSNSSLLTNDHGVAQGSTLGPFLFLIYINDLR